MSEEFTAAIIRDQNREIDQNNTLIRDLLQQIDILTKDNQSMKERLAICQCKHYNLD